jgi:hypothetical protein
MNLLQQAKVQTQEYFAQVKECWLNNKHRGLGVVHLSKSGRATYFLQAEVEEFLDGGDRKWIMADLGLLRINPEWLLVLVEIPDPSHPNFSGEILAFTEEDKIRVFNLLTGFQPENTSNHLVLSGFRTRIEVRSPGGVESVTFLDKSLQSGGEV